MLDLVKSAERHRPVPGEGFTEGLLARPEWRHVERSLYRRHSLEEPECFL